MAGSGLVIHMKILTIEEVAQIDLENMRMESALNVLSKLDTEGDDRLHVAHVIGVLRARIDGNKRILEEGWVEDE